jgi:hypothetical protein
MSARRWLPAGAALLVGALCWWLWLRPAKPDRASEPRAVLSSAVPLVALSQPTARDVTVQPAPTASIPAAADDEALLRELERLSATDKPLALARALEADRAGQATGSLAEARRALVVTLLVDLERWSEARVRARDFIALYPESRYRRLVQGATGIHPRPRPSEAPDAR